MRSPKLQNCNFAQCVPPISTVSTEQWRIGVIVKFCQQLNLTLNKMLHQKFLHNLYLPLKTKNLDTSASEDLVQERHEEFENHLERIKSAKVCEDVVFTRTVSVGQLFVTRSTVKLEGFGATSACRAYTHPLDKAIGNDIKIGPALDVVVTKQHNRYGVEIEVNSMMNGGTRSWVVIRRCIERFVTELALDHTEPMRVNEHTLSTVPWKSQANASTSSPSQFGAPIPMNKRKWEFKPGIYRVDDSCYQASKKMMSLPRPHPELREEDGRVEWVRLLSHLHGHISLKMSASGGRKKRSIAKGEAATRRGSNIV